ncbi:MAG: molybdenum cofactor guanylyltransferase [Bacteroidales bacterium]
MDTVPGNITAVILAGGKSTRFGGVDKAFTLVGKVPMIRMVIDRLHVVFENILVISNSPEKYREWADVSVEPDIFLDAGPLGGIHAGMKHSETPYIFVVSCDMPYIDSGLIRRQTEYFGNLENIDALVPTINSRWEPMHSIYRTDISEKLAHFLSSTSNYSIRAFLDTVRTASMEVSADQFISGAFRNINSPRDLL